MQQNIVVKQYPNERAMQADAAYMAGQGYRIAGQTAKRGNVGCARWLLLGIFAPLVRKRDVLVVTYSR